LNESTNLETELKCLKIYGEVILFGGSNGFLGVGAMGYLSTTNFDGSNNNGIDNHNNNINNNNNNSESSAVVMFCVPCCTANDPSLVHDTTDIASNSPFALRTISLSDDKDNSFNSFEDIITDKHSNSSSSGSSHDVNNKSISGGSGKYAINSSINNININNNSNTYNDNINSNIINSSSSSSSSSSSKRKSKSESPGFPHRKTSQVVCIAITKESNCFVAADDEGILYLLLYSIFYLLFDYKYIL